MVQVSKQELDDLRHKAEVSSQNFERLKKAGEDIKDLETQIADLQGRPDPSGTHDGEIGRLQEQVSVLTANAQKSEVLEMFPQLKEAQVWNDFEVFRADEINKGLPFKTAAKAFLTEKGLTAPTRPGLEGPTGGDRTPPPTGTMTAEDAAKLRTTDYKKYRELLKAGVIKIG